jgi:hypothetical protein
MRWGFISLGARPPVMVCARGRLPHALGRPVCRQGRCKWLRIVFSGGRIIEQCRISKVCKLGRCAVRQQGSITPPWRRLLPGQAGWPLGLCQWDRVGRLRPRLELWEHAQERRHVRVVCVSEAATVRSRELGPAGCVLQPVTLLKRLADRSGCGTFPPCTARSKPWS